MKYGYVVEPIEYIHWRTLLMDFTLGASKGEDHDGFDGGRVKEGNNALYPLLHFVLDDLPASTKAPELDDSNTRAVLEGLVVGDGLSGGGDMMRFVPRYLSYLVDVGFMDAPPVRVDGGHGDDVLPVLERRGKGMVGRSGRG